VTLTGWRIALKNVLFSTKTGSLSSCIEPELIFFRVQRGGNNYLVKKGGTAYCTSVLTFCLVGEPVEPLPAGTSNILPMKNVNIFD